MAERVYIETTVVSYLTARPNRDVVIAGHQQITHEWWDTWRTSYELCISQLVLDEAGAGDAVAAQDRLVALQPMLVLETTAESLELAKELLQAGALPAKAANDAIHVAVAATKAVPYLLTWNSRHLANAVMRPVMEKVCMREGIQSALGGRNGERSGVGGVGRRVAFRIGQEDVRVQRPGASAARVGGEGPRALKSMSSKGCVRGRCVVAGEDLTTDAEGDEDVSSNCSDKFFSTTRA